MCSLILSLVWWRLMVMLRLIWFQWDFSLGTVRFYVKKYIKKSTNFLCRNRHYTKSLTVPLWVVLNLANTNKVKALFHSSKSQLMGRHPRKYCRLVSLELESRGHEHLKECRCTKWYIKVTYYHRNRISPKEASSHLEPNGTTLGCPRLVLYVILWKYRGPVKQGNVLNVDFVGRSMLNAFVELCYNFHWLEWVTTCRVLCCLSFQT